MEAIIYDITSGHIKGSFNGPPDEVAFQVHNPLVNSYIEGTFNNSLDYIDLTGEPTVSPRVDALVTSSAYRVLNDGLESVNVSLPDPCHISVNGGPHILVTGGAYLFTSVDVGPAFIEVVGKYAADTVHINVVADLTAALVTKNIEIMKAYSANLYGGFSATLDGTTYTFDSDVVSMNLINGEASAAFETGTLVADAWKSSANTIIPLTLAILADLRNAMREHIKTMFTKKETLKAQVAVLTDLPSIEAFDILTIWN